MIGGFYWVGSSLSMPCLTGNFNFMPAKQRASFKRVYDKSQRTPTLGLLTEDDRIGSVCSECFPLIFCEWSNDQNVESWNLRRTGIFMVKPTNHWAVLAKWRYPVTIGTNRTENVCIQDNERQLTITETFSSAPQITMATGYELNTGTLDSRPGWWFSQELKKTTVKM